MPEVQHGRLREAADDLVRAGDHQVGARRQRVLGQLLVEGQVRAPRLVHDQRHAVAVRDRGQRAHVGHGAEVRRRDHPSADRSGRGGERALERLRGDGVRDPELGVELRRDERGAQPRQHERVDHA